ncbi:Alpha/Beta hydrolase protein [Jimgerdemannia flammicorona]|uniref:Alpha/Beta hydrolase protein n=1 Tax=Jimgerdemannia flammicorona TaxID=994334 RepID=A0A433BAS8_9FUNG|nr:Alpha/Beta hydrolase protein [Jimgerdemannia flammicorona]
MFDVMSWDSGGLSHNYPDLIPRSSNPIPTNPNMFLRPLLAVLPRSSPTPSRLHSTNPAHVHHKVPRPNTPQELVTLAFAKYEPPTSPRVPHTPLVVMHGLFGSKQNWKSLAKTMASKLETDVFTLDLRNHGESPHHHTHNYESMANDVASFMSEHHLNEAIVMGHSIRSNSNFNHQPI